jgi:hypothetical protein
LEANDVFSSHGTSKGKFALSFSVFCDQSCTVGIGDGDFDALQKKKFKSKKRIKEEKNK